MEETVKKQFKRGLVVGRFFPPHQGHLVVIRSAAQFCEEVTVCILDQEHQTLPIEIRQLAIQNEMKWYPNVEITHAEHSQSLEEAKGVDAIFSSDGKNEYAKKFQCAHVVVDPKRELVPVLSSEIRKDTLGHWSFLLPDIQAYLCKRFVVVGSESTGKSTLALSLSDHFRKKGGVFSTTPMVKEFGREYTFAKLAAEKAQAEFEKKPFGGIDFLHWSEQDFVDIATMQDQFETDATRFFSPLMICDTDTLATAIWYERYFQSWSQAVEDMVGDLPERGLYLLTDDSEIPFHADEIRNGEHLRAWMTRRFEEVLQKRKFDFIKLFGSQEERFTIALEAITKRLQWKWN